MNFSKIKKDLVNVYDDLADYWGKDKTLHAWSKGDYVTFSKEVGKGAKVLDLGCASGYQSEILTKSGLNVVGLDLSPKMIEAAKKRVPEAKFIVGDMAAMKFPKQSFDGVFARASLLHIPKNLVPKVVKKVNEILIKGGYFYLAVTDGEGEREVEDTRHGLKVKRFFSFFKESELENILEKAGFMVEMVMKHRRKGGSTTWIQIFARKIN